MRVYESMIVFHPDCGETAVKELLERAKQIVAGSGGEVTTLVEWGLKDLAYRIQKQRRGYFTILEFKGNGDAVAELERNLRIWDRVLRYITVQVDPNRPPLEQVVRPRREGVGGGEGGEDGGDDDGFDEGVDLESSDAN